MPTTDAGATPAAATALGTAFCSTSTQSAGTCSAQSGGSFTPPSGSWSSTTPCRYGCTAEASSAPSATRTTTARPDRVPKSTPTVTGPVAAVAGGDAELSTLSPSTSCVGPRCERSQRLSRVLGAGHREGRSGARPDQQLGAHERLLDDRGAVVGRADQVHQHGHRAPAGLGEALADRGQRRAEELRF